MASFFDLIKQPPVMLGDPYPLFNRISIETTSWCNRVCPFCPISKGTRTEKKSMDDGLFAGIVDQLVDVSFNGVVQLFLLNEPLLDNQLLERARALSSRLDCTIYVSTNADVVDKVGIKKLQEAYDAGITVINVNVYDSGEGAGSQHERYVKMVNEVVESGMAAYTEHKYQKHNPRRNYIALSDMRVDRPGAKKVDMFHNRSSVDRNKTVSKVPQVYCARPQRHLVVLWNGKVPLCCALDPTDDTTVFVGDAMQERLIDIWNNEMMFKYRWFTQQASRELPGCATCIHRMSYSHVVRKVTAPLEVQERWIKEAENYEEEKMLAQNPMNDSGG